MAINSPVPWLDISPADFVKAGEAGASAGLGASRIRQAGEQHSAQLAMEAKRLQQQAAMEAQRLSQAEHIAQMEMETRKEISEQNYLRQQQQHLIVNAQRQAEIGLGKARLERDEALATQKARESAMTFAEEAALTQYLKEHPGDVMGGLALHPRGRGMVNAITTANKKEGELGPVERVALPGGGFAYTRKGSKSWQLERKEKPRIIKQADGSIIAINSDNTIQTIQGPKTTSDATLSSKITGTTAETPSGIPPLAKASSRAESMMARARQLSIENPGWSKDKVKAAVREEFSNPQSGSPGVEIAPDEEEEQ